jgi:hypothetical protein
MTSESEREKLKRKFSKMSPDIRRIIIFSQLNHSSYGGDYGFIKPFLIPTWDLTPEMVIFG